MYVTFYYSSTCKMHINPYTKARLHAAVGFFFLPNQSLWSVLDMTGFDDTCNSIFHFIFQSSFLTVYIKFLQSDYAFIKGRALVSHMGIFSIETIRTS